MSNKEKILLCIEWFKKSAEQAEHWVKRNEYDEAITVIEDWLIKDANESLQYLKEGLKDG